MARKKHRRKVVYEMPDGPDKVAASEANRLSSTLTSLFLAVEYDLKMFHKIVFAKVRRGEWL